MPQTKRNKKVQAALNAQLNDELFAAYLYLGMSVYCEKISLSGFGKWLRSQAKEEEEHALKIFDFMLDRDCDIDLKEIGGVPASYDSLISMFEKAYQHESDVSHKIHQMYELAVQEKSYPTQTMLQWFFTEQVLWLPSKAAW